MKRMKKLILLMLIFALVVSNTSTVQAAPKINKKSVTLYVGQKTTLKISGTKAKVKWSSSNKARATVSSKGKVTAKKKGKVTITAKIGKKKYTCRVTIKNPFLNKDKLSLTVGETDTLKLTGSKVRSWKSSDQQIVTVNKKGKVTAKKAGNAIITAAASNGKKYTCTVVVNGNDSTSDTDNIHTHSYTSAVTKEPTCTENGICTYTCSCGASYEDVVPAKGHTFGGWEIKQPTCEQSGVREKTCVDCSYKEAWAIPATGHSWSDWKITKEATETETGSQERSCSNCNKTETQTIPKLTHTHKYTSQITKEATCTENGEKTYTCSCGDTYTETIPATGHNYVEKVTKEPTCTEAGEKTYTCSVCGASYTESMDATGHTWGDWNVEKAASCEASGTQKRICSICGKEETNNIPATGHSYEDVIDTAATCTTAGKKHQECSVCGKKTSSVTIPATGHSFGEPVVTNPTCTEDGTSVITCETCGYEKTTTLPATGHDYETTVTEPTCTEKGNTTKTCKNCGDTIVSDEVEALGHEESDPITTEGTFNPETGRYTPGTQDVKCTRCGEVLSSTTIVPANGTPYDDVDSIYTVDCGKDADGKKKYTYVVGHYSDEDAAEMFELINNYRVENGRTELIKTVENGSMDIDTKKRASEISINYDHKRPNGGSPCWAENIAMSSIGPNNGKMTHASTAQVFNAWIASEGHRNNILIDRYKYTGIQVFYLKRAYAFVNNEYKCDYQSYWVEEFE